MKPHLYKALGHWYCRKGNLLGIRATTPKEAYILFVNYWSYRGRFYD